MKDNRTLMKYQKDERFEHNVKTVIKMPELIGDTQIYVGQAVLMLIRLAYENNLDYSDKLKHEFIVELMDSVLAELNIKPEEIIELRKQNNNE